MEYKIISTLEIESNHADDKSELEWIEKKINDYIQKGWEPLGGISIRHGSTRGAYFVQTMIYRNKQKLLDDWDKLNKFVRKQNINYL